MTELGRRIGEAVASEPFREPPTVPAMAGVSVDPVLWTDLRRARQTVIGAEVHPDAALFASSLADAVAERRGAGTLPALRDAVFGGGGITPGLPDLTVSNVVVPDAVELPAEPALLCAGDERIIRVNPALERLAGRAAADLVGSWLHRVVLGPDTSAHVFPVGGHPQSVRVVRVPLPGSDLTVVLVLPGESGSEAAAGGGSVVDPMWVSELERLARVGTWTFELASGTLLRSASLEELYQAAGVDPDGSGHGPLEGEQVAALCRALRAGRTEFDHHVELRLPGDRMLSCRAEVERCPDGTPVRLVGVVHDVSAERIARQRVERSSARFIDLLNLTPGGVAVLDLDGYIVDVNPALCALLDCSPERLRGVAATALSIEDTATETAMPSWLRPVTPGSGNAYPVEGVRLRCCGGAPVTCDLTVGMTSADDGTRFWLVTFREYCGPAELARSAGAVDELTRLSNRASSLELMDRLLAGEDRDRVAVVCGDLDDFVRVNSSLGHEVGDDMLVTLAQRLRRELPEGCTAARLSGDEFAVICADHSVVGGPDGLASTVADLLRTTITVRGRPVHLTASIGLATPVPTGEVRAADLLRFAEAAMHDAKRRFPRGGIGVATDGVVRTATSALELEAELRAALQGDGLLLDYQPVVGPDGTVHSAEALVRWQHPERGLIPPADFLPVAQRSGLSRDLDIWVLRTAVREAATWPVWPGHRPSVAVNLAGLLPGDEDFLTQIESIVGDRLDWDRLVLELVETSLVALPPHALAAMAELTERGVRFAVDDFGTGYSSLSRLKLLPAQTVKVDRAFVTGVADDPADFAVARAVVDMARAMGRTTVAEGVETDQQFHVLRGIGVDAYQGWLFARPLKAAALHEVLQRGRIPTPAGTASRPA